MLECVGTSYGEMDPDGVIILVVLSNEAPQC